MAPAPEHETLTGRADIDGAVERLARLSERCRRQSMSMLVPMGQEMAYRYQETLIANLLFALRIYRNRLGRAAGGSPAPSAPLPRPGTAGEPGDRAAETPAGGAGIDRVNRPR